MASINNLNHQSNFDSIRIFSRYREYDQRADAFIRDANHLLHSLENEDLEFAQAEIQVEEVRTLKTYFLNSHFSPEQLENIAHHLLCDLVIEDYAINGFGEVNPDDFHFVVEVGYSPGVVDNEARTFLSALKDYFKDAFPPEVHAASGIVYLLRFSSLIGEDEVRELFISLDVNPLIERIEVKKVENGVDWSASRSLFNRFFEEFDSKPSDVERYEVIPLTSIHDDEELRQLSSSRSLYLSQEEMKAVVGYCLRPEVRQLRFELGLPKDPTDAELELIAQTWSEHCKHKIFAAKIAYHEHGELKETVDSLYRTYIKKVTSEIQKSNSRLLSVFTDNSGVFRFTDDVAVCMKVETHNSPSALDPFGGAITGIVGVNRDILGTGLGAKPIFNTDVFCFAPPDYKGPLPPKLFHPRRVMQGVHKGVERGGNESGIPTVNGAMVFDERFMGKPLVFCGTGGVLPIAIRNATTNSNSESATNVDAIDAIDAIGKEIHSGDLIVMVGGRIGKDGIHGATFSSVGLDKTHNASVVQIGDPIVQRKMTDFLMVARDRLLYRTLTDNGAGGLSSSVGEMAQLTGGCRLELDRALLKYPALKPWEILVSESQERMTLAVPPEKQSVLEGLAKEYDVEICFIGEFTDDGYFIANYRGEVVVHLSLDFLHNGVPQMLLKADWVESIQTQPAMVELKGEEYGETLKKLLARPNIASKESWVRRYDHEVKALTILKPFDGAHRDAPMDAAVLKPLRDSVKGLVVSNGLCPRLSDIDSYAMAEMGIDEAVRNAVASGGNPEEMYALDNFCWPDPISSPDNPDGEYKLAQLVRANQAVYRLCRAYGLPLISGKDSMKNDYGRGKDKISVPPTLLVTVLSVIPDYRKICSTSFKGIGSSIYLLGKLDGKMGGSELFDLLGVAGGEAPQVEAEENFEVYKGLYRAIGEGLVVTAHDVSDGGVAVTLAECCFGSEGGAEVDLSAVPGSTVSKLFSEPAGCLIVEVQPHREDEFLKLMGGYTSRLEWLGKTISEPVLKIVDQPAQNETEDTSQGTDKSKWTVMDMDVASLKKVWKTALAFH